MMGKIERGEAAPSFPSVEKIAAALDVPEAVLFSASVRRERAALQRSTAVAPSLSRPRQLP